MSNNIVVLQSSGKSAQNIYYEVDTTIPPIGVGGMGTVRKAVQVNETTSQRRDVAIKFLFDDLSPNALSHAEREASIRIVHENLIEMIDFVKTGEESLYGSHNVHYHVVSELLYGRMLEEMISNGEIDTSKAVRIVSSVLSGIMTLHDNGYIHRDIDPSNIMITSEGKVKLLDFGVARKFNEVGTDNVRVNGTMEGTFIGKPAYAAPELVRGEIDRQNATTDIYAIGILLYQLVSGTLPFTGSAHEIMEQQLRTKIPLNKIQDKAIRKFIEKATAKKQEQRYQSAAEFRAALDSYTNDGNTPSSGLDMFKIILGVTSVVGLITGFVLGWLL